MEGWYQPLPGGVWHFFETPYGMPPVTVRSRCLQFWITTLDDETPRLSSLPEGLQCKRCQTKAIANEETETSAAWHKAYERSTRHG